jgi:hypothetical protein
MNLPCDALVRRDEEFIVPLLCCCAPDMVLICVRPDVYGLFEREREEDVLVFVIGDDERPVVGQEEVLLVDEDEHEGLFERVLFVERRLFAVVVV